MKKPESGTGKLSEIRSKPGESGAFKHKSKAFSGPYNTFPIGDMPHARNALARAHFAKNPESVKEKVYERFPSLKKSHEERNKDAQSDYEVSDMKKYDKRKDDKRYQAYTSK